MTGKAHASSTTRSGSRALQRGARIHLRELIEDDAATFVAAANASRRLHHPWVQPPLTIAEFASRMLKRRVLSNSLSLLALRSTDNALVGIFNLSEIIRGVLQQAFIGYYGFAPHTGQGYMREGMHLVVRHSFRVLKLHRIEANVQPANSQSIALVSACGFVREGFSARYLKIAGRWRDHERWAINAHDWQRGPATGDARRG